MTVFIATGFLFIPFWNLIARKWGKRKAYVFSLLTSFVGLTLMILPQEGQKMLALLGVSIAGMSGIMSLTTTNFLYSVRRIRSNRKSVVLLCKTTEFRFDLILLTFSVSAGRCDGLR